MVNCEIGKKVGKEVSGSYVEIVSCEKVDKEVSGSHGGVVTCKTVGKGSKGVGWRGTVGQ